MPNTERAKVAGMLVAVVLASGCSSAPIDKHAATLDACCIDPTPADAKTQKFLTAKVRMQSITFCTTR